MSENQYSSTGDTPMGATPLSSHLKIVYPSQDDNDGDEGHSVDWNTFSGVSSNNENKESVSMENSISREELDAKLAADKAENTARFDVMESKIDHFLISQAERDKRFDFQFSTTNNLMSNMDSDIKSLKSTTIASSIAIVALIIGSMIGILQYGLSSFQAGKGASTPTEMTITVDPKSKTATINSK